jgi:tetratricopeptide (TPR) repeat protein
VLARVRKRAPREPEPYLISAELSLEAGRTEEAVRTVQDLADAGRDPTGLKRLGSALLERGEPATALTLLERAVQLDPGDAEALGTEGQALEAVGRLTAADAAYARSLERDPDHQGALRAGSWLRSEMSRGPCLPRSAGLARRWPEPSLQIALTWFAAGRPAAAVRVLQQARKGNADRGWRSPWGWWAKAGRWAEAARAWGGSKGCPGWKDAIVSVPWPWPGWATRPARRRPPPRPSEAPGT